MMFNKKYWIIIIPVFALSMFIEPVLCFLILGLSTFCLGVAALVFLKHVREKGVECTGVILEYQSDNDGHKVPFIEFTTLTGEIIKAKPFVYASSDLSKIRSYKDVINQSVLILYDPDNPKRFVLSNEEGFNYLTFAIFILAGSVFTALSVGCLLGYIKI